MSSLENAALLALVAIVPLVVLTLTSFVKLSVVLSLVRNAIGAPDAPSGLVVTGLSLVLTFFVMAPVAVKMVEAAATPAPTQPAPKQGNAPAPKQGNAPAPKQGNAPAPKQGNAPAPTLPAPSGAPTQPAAPGAPTQPAAPGAPTHPPPPAASGAQPAPHSVDAALRVLVPAQYQPQLAAAQRAAEPLRAFLLKHSRDVDRDTFSSLARKLGNETNGDELWVLAPAFITTELREAFAIAILIFIPFLVIDLVVALSLASLGLQTTSPQTVSLPFKLVLFVAVDGWRLLIDSLLRGYV